MCAWNWLRNEIKKANKSNKINKTLCVIQSKKQSLKAKHKFKKERPILAVETIVNFVLDNNNLDQSKWKHAYEIGMLKQKNIITRILLSDNHSIQVNSSIWKVQTDVWDYHHIYDNHKNIQTLKRVINPIQVERLRGELHCSQRLHHNNNRCKSNNIMKRSISRQSIDAMSKIANKK